MKLIAKTFQGLEEVLARELQALGAANILLLKRAVEFDGDQKMLYRANYELRTTLRILMPVANFTARNEEQLYRRVREIDWTRFFTLKDTFAIDAVTNSEYFRHSKFAALKTKDAIADEFRRRFNARPDVDVERPTLRIHLHIQDDQCSVSLDSSGESLHKRGYRIAGGDAPLSEVLAAGMILLSGWQGGCDLLDPMCGSGTIPIEAAMIAHQLPAQAQRAHFGFQNWKDFDRKLWETVRAEAQQKQRNFDHRIFASDMDFHAVKMTSQNIFAAGLDGKIIVEKKRFETLEPPSSKGLLMMNPPYDERLKLTDLAAFYKMIGDRLKHHFSGWTAWLISSNKDALKHVGLRPSRKITLFNGPLECKFQQFELFEGKRIKVVDGG